jgi:DeoR family fructose operon transcriptional repressor
MAPRRNGRLQHDRQRSIYMLALREGSVDVAGLASRYGVTTETIRRDLSDMQSRQLLRRVHGGAVPLERMNHEPMIEAREVVNAAERRSCGSRRRPSTRSRSGGR